MNLFRSVLYLFLFLFCLLMPAMADSAGSAPVSLPDSPARKLKIAVFERPPYTFKDKEGIWTGVSVHLWEEIAGRLSIPYEYVEVPLPEIYDQLRCGKCDMALAIALSGEQVNQVEFTEPYLFSHGAVIRPHKSYLDSFYSFYSYLFNKEVIFILFSMILGMAIFSVLLVIAEKNHEKGHFSGPRMKGVGSALWFSAVTMTTVGYGDKTPNSVTGRVITFFWMLIGVLLIALFTGTIASSITTEQIQRGIVHLDDLSRFHVGCYEGSRMDVMLRTRGIPAIRYPNPESGFDGFKKKEIDAYAGDSISLGYWMLHLAPGMFQISLIPDTEMIFAFETRPNLPELAEINRVLLQITLAPDWKAKIERWTGPLNL